MSTLGALTATVVELVTGYLDNALTAAEHTRFLDHIAACPNCATHVDQITVPRLNIPLIERKS
ncbi:MAG: zf-HC2 domain-containing protein [Actinomycetota bacterium]|nr:zf-HC2 domain-containing protein [Actinomycetota bacterium]MDQ6946726.1 zf-HC2 domain-containing protein [Actinomycetota bacterium]